MDAIPIKNTNSAVIARRALCVLALSANENLKEGRPKTHRITTLLETMKNASLVESCESTSKQNRVAIRPWEEDAGPTGENVKAQVRGRSYVE